MEKRVTRYVTELREQEVFVFGSNLLGQHGGGAARQAYEKFGAKWGIGEGLTGKSYAIPTMHGGPAAIRPYVERFTAFAKANPQLTFLVTEIGCGIAGFTPDEIAPLFGEAATLNNVFLPERFWEVIDRGRRTAEANEKKS